MGGIRPEKCTYEVVGDMNCRAEYAKLNPSRLVSHHGLSTRLKYSSAISANKRPVIPWGPILKLALIMLWT